MTSRLVARCFDASDPLRLARFWADALHWEIDDETGDEIGLVPTDDTRFRILFLPVSEKKAGKNRIHLDLTTTFIADQKDTVRRLVELARHIDIGQGRSWPRAMAVRAQTKVMLCSPIPKATSSASSSRTTPSSLTADASDRLGAMVRRRLGYFWSEALGWPLVWDQDQETAIRAPDGTGPFITWVRRFPRSSRRTGFISTSRRPTTVISERR